MPRQASPGTEVIFSQEEKPASCRLHASSETALSEILAEGFGLTVQCSHGELFEFAYLTGTIDKPSVFGALCIGHSHTIATVLHYLLCAALLSPNLGDGKGHAPA